ncbi:DUF3784 domain-containing protein [Enterococcus sp. BWM-S5]|uniref:DUF3784 domain-containing protein n=1 Tax=Enterococcus larvae TaxID=2794352 RepID=A0ABS4CJ89_9ENTE|nr:DUF3784 domain-containing protein [Enterococcus larvae]MBP1045864.1 DUF3784 domain-containing protein [Enterococcus larvae]
MDSDSVLQLGIALMSLVFGVQLLRGKWLMLIAGYNTMSEEKRQRVNGKALGKALGVFLLYVAVLCVLPVWFSVINDFFGWLIILPTLFLLVYTNISSRFKK